MTASQTCRLHPNGRTIYDTVAGFFVCPECGDAHNMEERATDPDAAYVYIVFGEVGQYSDWRTWPVRAYFDEAPARRLAEDLGVRMRQMIQAVYDEDGPLSNVTANMKAVDPLWDGHCFSTDAATYSVARVSLWKPGPDAESSEIKEIMAEIFRNLDEIKTDLAICDRNLKASNLYQRLTIVNLRVASLCLIFVVAVLLVRLFA